MPRHRGCRLRRPPGPSPTRWYHGRDEDPPEVPHADALQRPGSHYRGRTGPGLSRPDTGEELEVVGAPAARSDAVELPWAVENLRFCNWCDQHSQRDLNECPHCGRRMEPLGYRSSRPSTRRSASALPCLRLGAGGQRRGLRRRLGLPRHRRRAAVDGPHGDARSPPRDTHTTSTTTTTTRSSTARPAHRLRAGSTATSASAARRPGTRARGRGTRGAGPAAQPGPAGGAGGHRAVGSTGDRRRRHRPGGPAAAAPAFVGGRPAEPGGP